jgi:hypothetical protein
MFTCSKCQKEFKYNYLLTRHNNRKKSCLITKINIHQENNNFSDNNNISLDVNESMNNSINVSVKESVKDINESIKDINKTNTSKKIDKELKQIDKEIKQIDNKLEFNVKNSLKNNKCYLCEKEYTKKYNIIRHIKDFCICVKELNDKKDKLVEHKNLLFEKKENIDSKIEINELRNMVAKLLKKKSTNINITNNNKITNNNLMVNINSFGNESLSYITINDFSGLFPGFIKFIEKVR